MGNRDIPGVLIFGYADPITYPYVLAGLAALAVDMHLAATHGVCGQAAGFEESCRPQPFVDADLLGFSQAVARYPARP